MNSGPEHRTTIILWANRQAATSTCRHHQFAGGVPVSGVVGAGVAGAGVVGAGAVSVGAAGASGAGDSGAVVLLELSLQAASPRKDAAAIDAIRNFLIVGSPFMKPDVICRCALLFAVSVCLLQRRLPPSAIIAKENGRLEERFSQLVLPTVINRHNYKAVATARAVAHRHAPVTRA